MGAVEGSGRFSLGVEFHWQVAVPCRLESETAERTNSRPRFLFAVCKATIESSVSSKCVEEHVSILPNSA